LGETAEKPNNLNTIWPCILPLPVQEGRHEQVLRAVFGSKAAPEVLKRISPDGKTLQKDIISALPFSNKTVIQNLKKLVSFGVLEQGMEKTSVEGRAVWVKWFQPTFIGRWIITLLRSPEKPSREEIEPIVRELFKIYIDRLIGLCVDYSIPHNMLRSILDEIYMQKTIERRMRGHRPSRVLVFGSAALDTAARMEKIPDPGTMLYLPDTKEFPGGSGANVAVALSRLGVPVGFVGRLGDDEAGRILLDRFEEEGVDISGVVIGRGQSTPRAFITVDTAGRKRIYVLGKRNAALSIESPDEVSWSRLEKCDLVYIGETFLEVAGLVAGFARSHGKRVVYRPTIPYLERGVKRLENVLRNADVIILNEQGWGTLARSSNLRDPSDLLAFGVESVIVTEGGRGSRVYSEEGLLQVPSFEVEVVDTTGAGDAFVAGYIKGVLDGLPVVEGLRYANAVAALAVSEFGARTGFPTEPEVLELLRREENRE